MRWAKKACLEVVLKNVLLQIAWCDCALRNYGWKLLVFRSSSLGFTVPHCLQVVGLSLASVGRCGWNSSTSSKEEAGQWKLQGGVEQ